MTSFVPNTLLEQLSAIYPEFMVLHLYVDPKGSIHDYDPSDPTFLNLYRESIAKHNQHILENPTQYNAGFDLFVTDVQFDPNGILCFIDFGVACAAKLYRTHVIPNSPTNVLTNNNTGYYMYPRSSLCKSTLRLANSVGIIDSGYRGNLKGFFDVIPMGNGRTTANEVAFGNRITQICAPGLQPIYVVLVDSREELGETSRGSGGFGSTGR
jgi:dUTP pyrophosphatase